MLACPYLGSSESSFGRRTWDTLAGGIFVSKAACVNLEEFIKKNLIINAMCMHLPPSLEEAPTPEVYMRLTFTYNIRHESMPMAARPKIFRTDKP